MDPWQIDLDNRIRFWLQTGIWVYPKNVTRDAEGGQ